VKQISLQKFSTRKTQMEALFIHDGKAIDFLSSTAIPAGTVIVRGALVGITKLDVEANRLGALHVVGVYDVVKADEAIPLGSKVYWDATAKKAVLAAGTNPLLGIAVLDAAASDATVRVRLG
jgi:predicted RecA/RadA family phage recombinase